MLHAAYRDDIFAMPWRRRWALMPTFLSNIAPKAAPPRHKCHSNGKAIIMLRMLTMAAMPLINVMKGLLAGDAASLI